MKNPWLRGTALSMLLGLSGFVACSNSGGLAGQSGGMPGCGGAADCATQCGTAGGAWNGKQCMDRKKTSNTLSGFNCTTQ